MTTAIPLDKLLESRLDRYPVTIPGLLRRDFRIICHGECSLRAILPHLDAVALAHILDTSIWLDAPLHLRPKPEPGMPHSLVVAAYPEDAFLAMGGYLLKHRGRSDCVQAIFRDIGNDGLGLLGQPGKASQCRRDSASLTAGIVSLQNVWINLPPQDEKKTVCRAQYAAILYDCIARHQATDVFLPAPLAAEPDRLVLFDAAVRIFTAGYFRSTRFHVYELFPESKAHIAIDDFLVRTENKYLRLKPWFEDISMVLEDKQQLGRLLQPGSAAMQTDMACLARRTASAHGAAAGFAERFWTFGLTFKRS
jgi:hypothetical protein